MKPCGAAAKADLQIPRRRHRLDLRCQGRRAGCPRAGETPAPRAGCPRATACAPSTHPRAAALGSHAGAVNLDNCSGAFARGYGQQFGRRAQLRVPAMACEAVATRTTGGRVRDDGGGLAVERHVLGPVLGAAWKGSQPSAVASQCDEACAVRVHLQSEPRATRQTLLVRRRPESHGQRWFSSPTTTRGSAAVEFGRHRRLRQGMGGDPAPRGHRAHPAREESLWNIMSLRWPLRREDRTEDGLSSGIPKRSD
jgi:hypothetical protein